MKQPEEDIDARLERLARSPEAVRPKPNFGARVMQAIEQEREIGWLQEILRSARRVVPLAAITAAVTLFWAVRSQSSFDEAMAGSWDDSVEIEW